MLTAAEAAEFVRSRLQKLDHSRVTHDELDHLIEDLKAAMERPLTRSEVNLVVEIFSEPSAQQS